MSGFGLISHRHREPIDPVVTGRRGRKRHARQKATKRRISHAASSLATIARAYSAAVGAYHSRLCNLHNFLYAHHSRCSLARYHAEPYAQTYGHHHYADGFDEKPSFFHNFNLSAHSYRYAFLMLPPAIAPCFTNRQIQDHTFNQQKDLSFSIPVRSGLPVSLSIRHTVSDKAEIEWHIFCTLSEVVYLIGANRSESRQQKKPWCEFHQSTKLRCRLMS